MLAAPHPNTAYEQQLQLCGALFPWGPPKPREAYTHLLCARGPGGTQPAIAMGYSSDTLTGIWSTYSLDETKLQQIEELQLKRPSDFRLYGDDQGYGDIPQPRPRSKNGDYRGTGYDRGHLAPNGSMGWSKASQSASFYITNIAPQSPRLNREAWRCLEQSVKAWADRPGGTFVTTGVLFDREPQHIGNVNGIAVPLAFFMVVYQRAPGHQSADRAIALVMSNSVPNDVRPGQNNRADWDHHMREALRSVSQFEQGSGFDFGSEMSAAEQQAVEAQVPDPTQWPMVYPRRGEPASCEAQ